MGWFTNAAEIERSELLELSPADRRSQRYRTAEHEAGHVVVARSYGWEVERADIYTPTTGNTRIPKIGWVRDGVGVSAEDYYRAAMIALAGVDISRRHEWWPSGCGTDLDDARVRLAGAGVSWSKGLADAHRLVDRHMEQIRVVAERLYRMGRL
jgi:hypothetical protein